MAKSLVSYFFDSRCSSVCRSVISRRSIDARRPLSPLSSCTITVLSCVIYCYLSVVFMGHAAWVKINEWMNYEKIGYRQKPRDAECCGFSASADWAEPHCINTRIIMRAFITRQGRLENVRGEYCSHCSRLHRRLPMTAVAHLLNDATLSPSGEWLEISLSAYNKNPYLGKGAIGVGDDGFICAVHCDCCAV